NESVELYFAAADIVVLPYRSATQSGVVQVAYNFVRPVIVTEVGGLPEAVEQGKTGLLVPPEDPEALAQAIKRYFDDSLESVLIPGVRDARKLFSWERTVEALESLGASI
ncbi:MAG TPA: glycosyltransferase, partial [Armatimonadota bacterium]